MEKDGSRLYFFFLLCLALGLNLFLVFRALPMETFSCGDNGVKCADGLYCATGWCGTPPVIGICKKNGTCEWSGDCSNPDNAWPHVKCMGHAECTDNTCDWICDATR